VVADLGPAHRRPGIGQGLAFKLDLAAQLPEVLADANQIQQVVVNLLLNAADAIGGEGGEIRVGSHAEATCVAVEVQDSGKGIPPEDLSRIFEPFFTTKGHGTGLGLAVTWGIVDSHGGTIQAGNEPGSGACFTVRLPLASNPQAPSSAST